MDKTGMYIKRVKPYKASSPEDTVRTIRTLLENLGLTFQEIPLNENPLFKARILNMINPENQKIIFQSYGKGNTPEWASASTWGEMIERIQNLAFYMMLIYPSQPEEKNNTGDTFNYYPDEKIFSLKQNAGSSCVNNFEILTGEKVSHEKFTGVPFLNVFENKIEYFPFRAMHIIVGSNGMCSGNTREEALIQGISEIFERYVLKAFYLNPFTPPDIPLSCFEGTDIHKKIIQLTEQGFRVQIKDCSMNKGYPVIGVLVKNKSGGYTFHLGADSSPITALERCFTEMFQEGHIHFKSIDEVKKHLPYTIKTDFWKKNFSLTISAYHGHWPVSIFENEPDYKFNGFNHPVSASDQEDLQYLFTLLKSENRQVFIRDNSFLGHPSFHVYIPGMSEMTSQPNNSFSNVYLDFDAFLPVITNLQKSSENQRMTMSELLDKYIKESPNHEFRPGDYFNFFREHPVARLSSQQVMLLLKLSVLKGTMEEHFSSDEIHSIPFLHSLIADSRTFKPTEIFQKLNIPDCFNCENCGKKIICNFPYILKIWREIKQEMKSNPINQLSQHR